MSAETHTAECTCSVCHLRERFQTEIIRTHPVLSLMQGIAIEDRLRSLCDTQIAELLEEHVYAHLPTYEPFSELISSAMKRLERANGGSLPETSDE